MAPAVTRRLILAAALLGITAGRAAAQAIWFQPADDIPRRGWVPSPDWSRLFSAPEEWPASAAVIRTFGVSPYMTASKPYQGELLTAWRWARAHGKQFTVAMAGVPSGPDCGRGMEGFTGPGQIARTITHLTELGIVPDRVEVDTPLGFGTQPDRGPFQAIGHTFRYCGYPLEQLAPMVAASIAQMKGAWPHVRVDEIEGLSKGSTATELPAWLAAERRSGFVPTTLISDTAWNRAGWQAALRSSMKAAREVRIPVGVIADGGGRHGFTEAQAVADVKAHVLALHTAGIWPAFYVVASWVGVPSHSLPETNPSTFTGLVLWLARNDRQLGK